METLTSGSSDLSIFLLGPKNAGKSSAGNTILGKRDFDIKMTVQSADKCGEVSGRKVTIIDTPGWWETLPYKENPELSKQEVVLSFTRCAPGPHVLLLVLNLNTPFKQKERDILYENMRCFGDEVWRHTIVLFTCVDLCGPEKAKKLIKSESESIQWLLNKCEDRYHVLNIKNKGDGSQVTELLKKIQKMVDGNKGGHYEIQKETLQHLEEERRTQEKRAEERRVKTQKKTSEKQQELAELRIVLLGYNQSGKSSAGNTILGRSAFDLKSITSVIREADVAGRHITVVDTPGRRRNFCSQYTPKLYKDEIILSSSLCPPGPHVFLLVIRVDVAFTEVYRQAVEEHASSLGLDIWDHMIVLFTFGDWLVNKSIELFIESEGDALQWIVEKCENRYHVFNNQDKDDGRQVTELFEKIEEMVAGKEGGKYKMSNKKVQEVKERRVKAEEKAKQMIDQVQKRIEARRLMSAEYFEMGWVLFGPHCSGKIATGNTILGREAFVKSHSGQNLKEIGEVAGRDLTVVYTAGFQKYFPFEKTLEDDTHSILRSVVQCSPGPHAFILTLCIDCSFADEEKSRIEKIMEPLGERVWNHILVLFTDRDQLGDTPIELFIASEGEALLWLIEKCGNRYHVLNIKNRGDGSQVTELLEKMEQMVAGNRGCHYELDQQTLETVEKRITVPIRRTWSIDDPLNFAKECTPTSGIDSGAMSQREEGSQTELLDVLQTSRLSSGVESLGSIPEFDDFDNDTFQSFN